MSFELTSPAFSSEGTMPDRYTCEGADVSPPLEWANAPEGTQEFALICEDPDASGGTFVHWLLYGVPAGLTELLEDVSSESELPWGAVQGRNDFGNVGYGGPCPPMGETHRYFFRLHALEEKLDLPPGLSRNQLLREIADRTAGRTGLMVRYGRPQLPV